MKYSLLYNFATLRLTETNIEELPLLISRIGQAYDELEKEEILPKIPRLLPYIKAAGVKKKKLVKILKGGGGGEGFLIKILKTPAHSIKFLCFLQWQNLSRICVYPASAMKPQPHNFTTYYQQSNQQRTNQPISCKRTILVGLDLDLKLSIRLIRPLFEDINSKTIPSSVKKWLASYWSVQICRIQS